MSYLMNIFTNNVNKENVKTIFEIGSCHLLDAEKLQRFYDAKVFAFECNPDCLIECNRNLKLFNNENIVLVEKAITDSGEKEMIFYPFDLSKYNNMAASSMLKIDFSKRNPNDYDFNRPNPQKEVRVKSISLLDFCSEYNTIPDMLCIDVQGYELNVLKSMKDLIKSVKYIITESSVVSTYNGGASFKELNNFMEDNNFKYVCSSNTYGWDPYDLPKSNITGYSEFDCLFVNNDYLQK